MTPAEALDKLWPRLREGLPAKYTPEYLDGFLARNRAALEDLAVSMLALRRVKRGEPPVDLLDFETYGDLALRQRGRDAEADEAVIGRVITRLDKLLAKTKDNETRAYQAMRVFGEIRALALLLRGVGYDAVPLLLRRPALVLLRDGRVLAVVDETRQLHFLPGTGQEDLDNVSGAIEKADEQLRRLRVGLEEPTSRSALRSYLSTLWDKARTPSAPARAEAVTPDRAPVEIPPDLRDRKWRTEANIRAIRLVHDKQPEELTAEERTELAAYSGWGGLSIEAAKKSLPEDLVPETFGLIHEYYTPQAIADAVAMALCPLLPEVAGHDGIVRALEPSAGIGRLIRAFTPQRCLALEAGGKIKGLRWTAVEFSKVSATLLRALRPDVDLYHMPFERWVAQEGSQYRGTIGLIVSNPPYGERGAMAREDPDEDYKEKRAFAYFMRRALDLLVPGGIGVFLIPAGFLSGNLNEGLREKLLRRHHLLGAFRLPSHDRKGREIVPGAAVVMDVVFWQSRGGELTEVDPADEYILSGGYFTKHPEHLLGKEDGAFAGDDEAGTARSWRYKVTGDFKGLPSLAPRPICSACVLSPIAPRAEVGPVQKIARTDDDIPGDVDEDLQPALELGRRVGRYLAAVGADEADKAQQLWPELHAALRDFSTNSGNPWKIKALRELAEGRRKLTAAQQLLGAFDKSGSVTATLREPPKVAPKFAGQPDDVLAQAEALFRQQRALPLAQLVDFHRRQGGTLSKDAIVEALLAATWNLDGPAWDHLLPSDAYLTGNDLWDRHDRAIARGDEQGRIQARRLLGAIKPAVFDDLTDISPQHGYVPLDLVAGWLSATLNARYGAIELERKGGFVQVKGHDYTRDDLPPISPETLSFLGFYNHDPELFRPPQEKRDRDLGPASREERAAKKQSLAERRIALAKKWDESFKAWVAADQGRREKLVHTYNRVARGRVVPTFPPEPLDIARWGPMSPKLKPHQIAGARRVLAQRGGLLAFDVGVGKTYTALAVIARARQEGWVRRPVILVPGSLVWKWHDDILCTLPDYRVVVIGSKRKQITRGPRKGVITSETDTPEERAKKWTLLQTGQVDVAVLSYDALARTKMNEDAVMAYIEQVEAVSRSIALRKRTLQEKAQSDKAKGKLTERELALLEHGVRAWVEEILALPSDWEYDPGVAWDEVGCDMLVVDEAAAFKNLYKPQPREDGVPKFMGGGGEGSDRAWQLDFRAAAVRRKTGGAGVVLLTATPAKNSPLEFYNLIQFIDPTAFTNAGIRDPEQFIDRFIKIEYREVLDSTFEVTKKSAVTGFKNLDDLRTIIFTYGEFRTAAEVGLKLPRPLVETITIKMDDEQEAKYARYVAQIEHILDNPSPEGGESYAILGLLARLSLVALHASLEEGYTYKTALVGGTVQKRVFQNGEAADVAVRLGRPTYESPKLTECAKRVAASPHCGHIIFCEPTAVHQWMREVLIQHGIPRERIAILNAEETAPADRIRIAREFNGLSSEPPPPGTCARPQDSSIPPKYDVVIANSVAYEGIDLQVRTCTIHHLDLPWTPADLEQRNGRAVRQGNTLGTVQIFYYFADGSTDGYRFSLIDGKAGWLGELIKSQVRDTNNPAAQQQLTPEDILLMISRNKEKTKALLEEKRKRQVEEARARIAKEAARLLRQAAGRFRDARSNTDPERAARLREEGDARLSDLEQVNPEAWPWAPWMYAVRDTDMIVPENGGAPVYEGLRLARPRAGAPDQLDFLEFGQIVMTDEGERIGLRAAGSSGWQIIAYAGALNGSPIAASELPRDGGPLWPEDDDARTGAAIERKIAEVFPYGLFESLRWRGATDAWIEKWWSRFESAISEGLARSQQRETVPVLDAEGLAVASGAELRGAKIVPPTRAGWQRFLELAPASGESFTTLKDVGLGWWGRKVPQDLLSKDRNLLRELIVPRLLEDSAYRNAREHSDAQNARIEHDKALDRVMLALFSEDSEKHSELYRRYSDDEAWRRSLQEQSFAATYSSEKKVKAAASATPSTLPAEGHVYFVDRSWFADTRMVNSAQFQPLTSIGSSGDFAKKLTGGTVYFVYFSDDPLLPKQEGRLYSLTHSAGDAALEDWVRAVIKAGKVEHVGTWPAFPKPALAAPSAAASSMPSAASSMPSAAASSTSGTPSASQTRTSNSSSSGSVTTGRGRGKKPAGPVRIELAQMPTALPTPPNWADRLVDAFNADAGPQLAFSRRRGGDTAVFVVHAEERPDRKLAVVDVVDEQLDDVRWLDDSLTPAQQSEITARIEQALAHLDPDKDRSASLTRTAIEKFKARAIALGADPERAASAAGSEEFRWLAEALRDLAGPRGTDAEDLAAWLAVRSLRDAAKLIRAWTGEAPLENLFHDLWNNLEANITLSVVDEQDRRVFLVHPQTIAETDQGPALVLRETDADGRPRVVPVRLREDCEDDHCLVESDLLRGGERAWHLGIEWDLTFILDLYRMVREFEHNIWTAPEQLAEVRELLHWAAAMIDTPRCRGESRRVAEAAIRDAKDHYDRARKLITQGDSPAGVAAMSTSLRKIAEVASELAESCAAGQATLPSTPGELVGELRVEMRAPSPPPRHRAQQWASPRVTASASSQPSCSAKKPTAIRRPIPSAIEQARTSTRPGRRRRKDLDQYEGREFYLYRGYALCEPCGELMRRDLHARGFGAIPPDQRDSDEYPQGPYTPSAADAPAHCGRGRDCLLVETIHTPRGLERLGAFLGNPLTDRGEEYVREQVALEVPIALQVWGPFYGLPGVTREHVQRVMAYLPPGADKALEQWAASNEPTSALLDFIDRHIHDGVIKTVGPAAVKEALRLVARDHRVPLAPGGDALAEDRAVLAAFHVPGYDVELLPHLPSGFELDLLADGVRVASFDVIDRRTIDVRSYDYSLADKALHRIEAELRRVLTTALARGERQQTTKRLGSHEVTAGHQSYAEVQAIPSSKGDNQMRALLEPVRHHVASSAPRARPAMVSTSPRNNSDEVVTLIEVAAVLATLPAATYEALPWEKDQTMAMFNYVIENIRRGTITEKGQAAVHQALQLLAQRQRDAEIHDALQRTLTRRIK